MRKVNGISFGVFTAFSFVLLLAGCGGGGGGSGPAGPDTAMSPTPATSATTVTLTNGANVDGAEAVVMFSGKTLQAIARSGKLEFSEKVPMGTPIDITFAGGLPYKDFLVPEINLWEGDRSLIVPLVYNEWTHGRLWHPSPGAYTWSPNPQIAASSRAMQNARDELGSLSAITSPYGISLREVPSGGDLTLEVAPAEHSAEFIRTGRGGRLLFTDITVAEIGGRALHEAGHWLGLGHDTDPDGAMNRLSKVFRFAPWEADVIRMLLRRENGRYPDDTAAGRHTS